MCKNKIINNFFKPIALVLAVICGIYMGGIAYMEVKLPDQFNVTKNKTLKIDSKLPVEAIYGSEGTTTSNSESGETSQYEVKLKALGIFPIKNASVSVIEDTDVYILGNPFGIKIYTDGVMVVGIDTVVTEKGSVSPAEEGGLKKGDLIVSINGQNVYSNEDVARIIEGCGGSVIVLKIMRDSKQMTINVTPALCFQSGKYKTGIWVRDSSAGIGTLTFYSPKNKIICGLGHGICDIDTGKLLTLNSGELVKAEILGVNKGKSGAAGELVGKFCDSTYGELVLNNDTGVYAKCEYDTKNLQLTKMALKQEVKTGNAKIYTTIDGEAPAYYSCKIEKIAHNNSVTKNMVIRITDKKLIEKTGGIVQGMSGSPIIQNGKLVGAVTHVFLDDPTAGYGIFAENMLKSAQSFSNAQLKDAS